MEARNTAKEKKKRNKGYPYKRGGHKRDGQNTRDKRSDS